MNVKRLPSNNPHYNLEFKFAYNADLVARCNKLMKQLTWQRFRYNSNSQSWYFKLEDLALVLKEFTGVDVQTGIYEEFLNIVDLEEKNNKDIEVLKTTPIETDLPLYKYQKIGVNFIVNNPKCALFDEVRLGKLYQAVGAIHHLHSNNVLVICPNTTKANWQRKIKELIGRDSNIVDNAFTSGINIINYEGLQKFSEKTIEQRHGKPKDKWIWQGGHWDMLIIDESHKIKGGKSSIRGTLAELVAKQSDRVVLLTATPMPTHIKDLVPQLRSIDRLEEFGGEWKFLLRYCNGKKTRFGWDFNGASHLDELNEKLSKFTLRRLQSEVWQDLPTMREDVTYLTLPEPLEYYRLQHSLNNELMQASKYYKDIYKSLAGKDRLQRAEVLLGLKDDPEWKGLTSIAIVKIEKLKQEVVRQKLIVVPEILQEYLDTMTKVVVFGVHKKTVSELHKKYPDNSVMINGDVKVQDRQPLIDLFSDNRNIVFAFVTMDTCNEGLDFSVANHIITTELDWTPDKHTQASGRILNPEKKAPTNSNYVVINNTIEDDIIDVLLNKSGNIEKVIGGEMLTKVLSKLSEPEEAV